MSWIKLSDTFFRHPKAIAAGFNARMLYIAGLCYCGAGLTDGAIPEGALEMLAAETEIRYFNVTANKLVEVGLWERTATGYQVHDFLEFNDSAETRAANKTAARERMKRLRSSNVRANIKSDPLVTISERTPASLSRVDGESIASVSRVGGESVASDSTRDTLAIPISTENAPSEAVRSQNVRANIDPMFARSSRTRVEESREELSNGAKAPIVRSESTTWYSESFETLWTAYPKHTGKKNAYDVWRRLNPSDELRAKIATAIEAQKQGRQWLGGFVPEFHRWLTQRRWDDVVEPPDTGRTGSTANGKAPANFATATAQLDDYRATQRASGNLRGREKP